MGKMKMGTGPKYPPLKTVETYTPAPSVPEVDTEEIKAKFEAMLSEMAKKHQEQQESYLATMRPSFQEVSTTIPEKIVEKAVEKVETVREVSVITKDKRVRKYSKLVAERLELQSHKLKVMDTIQEGQSIDIEDLKAHCQRLEMQLAALSERESKLEAQIPEEKQEVKAQSMGLVYLGVTASILLSILGLILK